MLVWTVFDYEPDVDERLLGSEKVVGCPHVGTATVETMMRSITYFLLHFGELRDKS